MCMLKAVILQASSFKTPTNSSPRFIWSNTGDERRQLTSAVSEIPATVRWNFILSLPLSQHCKDLTVLGISCRVAAN